MAAKLKRQHFEVGDSVLNGRYRVTKVVHTSGMSNVYLVSDSNLNKTWCLKEIKKSESGRNKVEYYSLLQEANIMKGLNHSSIPRIVTIEGDGDSLFIVMDYVDGVSLKAWIRKKQRIKQDVAVTWMKQICQVMIYLHNRPEPIFYRDMKPDNVMLQSDGNIKVLDFGISVVIKEPGQKIKKALGTAGYAAPEQSKSGLPCDLRSDIYAMGKTMYYMLTGLNPSRIPKDKIRPVRDIDSSISIGIEKIVDKCTQENPDDRYQSCEELLYALQNYDSLDTKYRVKARRKVNLVMTLFMLSLFIIITSFIPLMMDRRQKSDQYQTLLDIAYQSDKVEDYEAAIEENPLELSPYSEYIEAIKVDGVFSKAEEEGLLNLINPNLSKIKEESGYGEVAYEIGRLYWFYYEGSEDSDGSILSVKWFNDAVENEYEVQSAQVYYNLGLFKRDISMSIAESSDAGMYKAYWDNLIQARSKSQGELVDLQLNLALAECISSYGYRLNTDGIAKEEVLSTAQSISSYMESFNATSERSAELYKELETTMLDLNSKIDAAYSESAVTLESEAGGAKESDEVQNTPTEESVKTSAQQEGSKPVSLDNDLGGGL